MYNMYQQGHQHGHHQHGQHPGNKVNYPVRFTYVNKINNWWPPEKILADLGVPEHSGYHIYNYVALSFWTYQNGPVDIALLWSDPMKYFGNPNPYGSTKEEVQRTIKGKYNKQGIKLMVSAFGATQMPTTANINPVACAQKLGNFVKENNLDGVDIDWEDNHAMENGTGQQWLIAFTQKLRQIIPNHIITHAPQAPYFCAQRYKNGAYVNVNKQVGDLIDFYNVQFYNQGNNTYDTYEKLFVSSGSNFPGTAVKQIAEKGVLLDKIVVGKPVCTSDATNTGYMDRNALCQAVLRANQQGNWRAGVMLWQFASDQGGQVIKAVAEQLKHRCQGKH